MKKRQLLKHSVFLLLFYGLFACQDDYLKNEDLIYDLDPVGKAFMSRLKESPDWSVGWKYALRQGKVLPNEAALLYGGGYGWHYVLPLVEEKTVMGLVIYPIEGIGEDEGPESGRLGKPVVRVGKEASKDPGASGFLSTRSFHKWQKNGLEISEELDDIRTNWGPMVLNNLIPRTKATDGGYICFYQLEFENYLDDDGFAVVVSMEPRKINDLFHRITSYFPFRLEIEVTDEYVGIMNCDEAVMRYYLEKAIDAFEIRHAHLQISYIWGYDCYNHMIDEYPNSGGGSGGSGGGGGGGGGGNGSGDGFGEPGDPNYPDRRDSMEHAEIREVVLIVSAITTGSQAAVKIGTTNEMYYVPLYKAELTGTDANGKSLSSYYEVIRFGVKSINDVATVVGLSEENIYTVQAFLPGQYGSEINGDAWQIYGNFLIHVGPKKLAAGVGAYGCIEICHGKMTDFNQKILQYSNATDGSELVSSGKFLVYIQAATKPPLVPKY